MDAFPAAYRAQKEKFAKRRAAEAEGKKWPA
jgi:hypothetical protein